VIEITWPKLEQLRFTPEQIADRRNCLGGSDMYDLRRGNWTRLWAIKTGRSEPDDLTNMIHVQLGIWTEEFARQWFEEVMGLEVRRDDQIHTDPNHPWRRAHTDGLVSLPDGRTAVLEIKTTSKAPAETLETYNAQIHHEMAATSLDVAILFAIHSTGKIPWWSVTQIEKDREYLGRITKHSQDFWDHVVSDTKPRNPSPTPLF